MLKNTVYTQAHAMRTNKETDKLRDQNYLQQFSETQILSFLHHNMCTGLLPTCALHNTAQSMCNLLIPMSAVHCMSTVSQSANVLIQLHMQ
jgi:hypothetical protein